ncbi:MAG: hypothetical protein AB1641_12720 [Thermodesulfobacteriota bacterium]
MSDRCLKHPDRPAAITCLKMDLGYCQECLDECEACTDPCAYCKFRPQCVIWELCKRHPRRYEKEKEIRGESS